MARKKKILWRIYPSYVLITLISLLAVGGYASWALKNLFYDQTSEDLLVRARLIERLIKGRLASEPASEIDRFCKELGKTINTRITVILPSGLVIADSEEDPGRMENHANRPEVIQALATGVGKRIHFSRTLRRTMIYEALAVTEDGKVIAIVRTSHPVANLSQTLLENYLNIALAGLIAAGLAISISWLVARRLGQALADMRQGALRFAKGDLDYRLRLPETEEFSALADTMNTMAQDLQERIRTVTGQRNELAAILAGMIEAVLVVDRDNRLVRINQAGAKLFGVDPAAASGKKIEETMRNSSLLRFISETLAGDRPIEGEMEIRHEGEKKFLQAHGNVVRDDNGRKSHALLVLHDVTALKKLEQVRRDFVANVSHELRTPLTSIKGYVDTLRDGALDDPDSARKFIEIIARHTDRLGAIIEDLLDLSRIEENEKTRKAELGPGPVREVLSASVAIVKARADERGITIELDCPDDLVAQINAPLLEQAVVNLLDNAVKYSDPRARVRIAARRTPAGTEISVEDQGWGIPSEDLDRVFERFYRVDKARSRKAGGTGLGLAIVKHIVQVHRGRVSVTSAPGPGSVFTILLPDGGS